MSLLRTLKATFLWVMACERKDICKLSSRAQIENQYCVYTAVSTVLKVGSHYERLFQRWPAFEKSNK